MLRYRGVWLTAGATLLAWAMFGAALLVVGEPGSLPEPPQWLVIVMMGALATVGGVAAWHGLGPHVYAMLPAALSMIVFLAVTMPSDESGLSLFGGTLVGLGCAAGLGLVGAVVQAVRRRRVPTSG